MGIFQTNVMTLKTSSGTVRAQHLRCQLDTVNLPFNMENGGLIPTDWYDVFSIGWTTPVPARSDYLVDESTNVAYSVFSVIFQGMNTLQFRVTKYSGVTP